LDHPFVASGGQIAADADCEVTCQHPDLGPGTYAQKLRAELTRIRRTGYAEDKGEAGPSIHVFAAPVQSSDGSLAAALSVPFRAGDSSAREDDIRLGVIRTARAISDALKG